MSDLTVPETMACGHGLEHLAYRCAICHAALTSRAAALEALVLAADMFTATVDTAACGAVVFDDETAKAFDALRAALVAALAPSARPDTPTRDDKENAK